MSKKRKTIEKLLEEALVSEGEQPYEIPDNWVWVKLDTSKKDRESFGDGDWILSENIDPNGEVRLIQLSDIGQGKFLNKSSRYISMKTFEKLRCREIFPGDILISRMAHPIARSCIVPDLKQKLITAVDVAYLRPNEKIFDTEYLNYMFNSIFFRTEAEGVARGTTRLRITRKNLGNLAIPFPPLNEQKRIADKVERLLGKIEEAKQLIEEAKETFELRRAAILDKAFRGELTTKWREENKEVIDAIDFIRMIDEKRRNNLLPKEKPNYLSYIFEKCVSKIEELPSSWVQAPVGFMCDCIVPGRDKPKSFTGDIPWITIPDIKQDYLNKSNASFYLNEEEIKEVKAKVIPSNSVVMSCVGRFGVSAIVNTPLVINQQLHAFLPSEMINPKYLMYQIRTLVPYMNKKATSTTISYLNKTNANSLPINVPPIEEQKKIVEILDHYFKRDSNALNLIENQLEQIEQIKTSILAKAFRGELGTNDPNEEMAIELLKEVLQEQVK